MGGGRLRLGASELICLVTLVGLTSGCSTPPEPRDLFARAAERIAGASIFEYSFEFRRSGQAPELVGHAAIERLDLSGSNYRARVSATSLDPVTGEPLARVEVVRRRDDVYALDERGSTIWFSSLYAAGPSLEAEARPALMYPFFDPHSLEDEANATDVRWEGRREIGGIECASVHVTYADEDEDSRWCFDEEGFPRFLEWIGEGGSRLAIADLRVDTSPSEGMFDLPVSEGLAQRERSIGPPLGSLALDWTLPRLDGGTSTLADLRGRVVVLDFWATWCPPCLDTLTATDRFRREMAGLPVSFFAVNTMESGDPKEMVQRLGLSLPVLLEGDEIHKAYTLGNLPAMVVIDASGRHAGLTLGYYGERSEQYARRLIEGVVAEVAEASSDTRAP